MERTHTPRSKAAWTLGLLALGGLAVALVFGWSPLGGRQADAETAGQTNFAMAIDVNGDSMDDCDTRGSTMTGTMCTVSVGNMFTLRGYIDAVANKGALAEPAGYIVFQFTFAYTSPGLTRNDRVSPNREVGNPTYWEVTPGVPATCSPNGESDGTGTYYVDCWQSTQSRYTGKLVEVDFTCSTAGTRTITMQDAGTYVHNSSHGSTPEDKDGDETLTIMCGAPTPTPTPKDPDGDSDGDGIPNSEDPDDDNDGCTDVQEEGPNQSAGGRRNPHVFWDFFDTPDNAGNRDKAISVSDINRIVMRFGSSVMPAPTKSEALAQAFTAPPSTGYHVGFDRTQALPGMGAWATSMPNGSITVQDISLEVASFGHSCITPP